MLFSTNITLCECYPAKVKVYRRFLIRPERISYPSGIRIRSETFFHRFPGKQQFSIRAINASYLQSYPCRSIISTGGARTAAPPTPLDHFQLAITQYRAQTRNNRPRQSSYRHHVYYRNVIKCPPPSALPRFSRFSPTTTTLLSKRRRRRNIPMIFISACQAGLAEGRRVTGNRL